MADRVRTYDAVIIVPGIMGSQLEDQSGKVLWGLSPKLMGGTWISGRSFAELQVTPEEAEGTLTTRVFANGPLRFAGHLPNFGGIEPYTELQLKINEVVLDPKAVRVFGYDWRLPVEWHVGKLVDACRALLKSWREFLGDRHPEVDRTQVRVALVAHSMGGLLARLAAYELSEESVLSRVITLGTPYQGSVKAARMMIAGEGMPFPTPTLAARELARSCPGVYDLLPRYPCYGPQHAEPAEFTSAALAHLCPQPKARTRISELADQAAERWQRNRTRLLDPQPTTLHHLVGGDQPTAQSIVIDEAGLVDFPRELAGFDLVGDGTVPTNSATLDWVDDHPIAQQHGALAKGGGAYFAVQKLIKKSLRPTLGAFPLGMDAPSITAANAGVEVGVDHSGLAAGLSVISEDLSGGPNRKWAQRRSENDGSRIIFGVDGLPPGLHRVTALGGDEPVSVIMLAAPG